MIEYFSEERCKSYFSTQNHSKLHYNCTKLAEIWLFLTVFFWLTEFGGEMFQFWPQTISDILQRWRRWDTI